MTKGEKLCWYSGGCWLHLRMRESILLYGPDPQGVWGWISEKKKMSEQKQKEDKRWWKSDKRDESIYGGMEGIPEGDGKIKFWQGEWGSREQQVWLAAEKSIWGYHGSTRVPDWTNQARPAGSTPSHSGPYWRLTLRHRSSSQTHIYLRYITTSRSSCV